MNNFFNKINRSILALLSVVSCLASVAQINTNQVMIIGRNALYFEDYLLSIQYFNQVIRVKPYLAEPYFYRAVAKLSLEDYRGAEEDCTLAIERNPFIVDAYQVRGIARQTLKNYRGAIDDYSKGLEQLPEHKVFLINKAVAEEQIEEYDASENTYKRLIELYPNYENAYLGRSQLYLSLGDTVKALADIDKCISINKNNSSAYVMRSDITTKFKKDYKAALADMDDAIKLEPHIANYFINRAFLKYNLDDYFGAMADYDYAIDLDPSNITARFNRGLLLTEVQDNNKAINDFTYVLDADPSNIMARYNRAELFTRIGQYSRAVSDLDQVIAKVDNMPGLYYARSECKRKMGDLKGGEADYNKSRDMSKQQRAERKAGKTPKYDSATEAEPSESQTQEESVEDVKNKFQRLLTIENDNSLKPQYENKTRGRIQDNSFNIDAEPQFMLSYYDSSSDLKATTNYLRELNEINELKLLPNLLMITNGEVRLFDDQIEHHFNSINYYTGIISTNPGRAFDYFARAIDFMMVKNYDSAIADLDKAIALSDKFVLAYFARANAKFCRWQAQGAIDDANAVGSTSSKESERMMKEQMMRNVLGEVMADLDKVIELSPKMVYAMYDKGCVYLMMQDNTSALSAFSKAVEIKPDFGEAYYNRGLVFFRLGNKENGVADLSKAGEFGITPSYSVLKRMSR